MAKETEKQEKVKDKAGEAPAPEAKADVAILKEFVRRSSIQLTDGGGAALAVPPAEDFATKSEGKLKELVLVKRKVKSSELPVTGSDLYLHRLRAWRDILKGMTGDDADVAKLKQRQGALDEAHKKNLALIFEQQRPLEKTYRELDLFFKKARHGPDDRNLPVSVANVSAEELCANDALFRSFAKQLPKKTSISLKKLPGLIVLPGWLGTAALEKVGLLALETKSLVVTDFDDIPLEKVQELSDPGELLDGLKGTEEWKQQVVLVGNRFRIRKLNPFEKPGAGEDEEEAGLYLSPSVLFGAMVFYEDDEGRIAVPVANRTINVETPDKSAVKTKWHLTDRQDITNLFKDCVIPLAWSDDKLLFWDAETLSSDTFAKQYNVRRVKEYIDKCITHYLNQRTFMLNEEEGRDQLRDKLGEFLRENMGAGDRKMLDGGQVIAVKPGQAADEIDIRLELVFKFAAKYMNVEYLFKDVTDHFDLKSETKTEK